MEKIKIKVSNNKELKEAQELLMEIYCKVDLWCHSGFPFFVSNFEFGAPWVPRDIAGVKEVTIQELKDLAVLKRNDVADATHADQYGDKWICASGVWYFYSSVGEWSGDCKNMMHRYDLKPIQKEQKMKEFLDPSNNYEFIEWNGISCAPENWIEVPASAEVLAVIFGDEVFYKSGRPFQWFNEVSKKWMDCGDLVGVDSFENVLWQREKESINDKVASTEEFRKESIVDKLADLPELKISGSHSHYFKDVSDIDSIDVYEVLKRFNVTDPCLQHIVKKALCAGNRGHKDFETDLKNIYDTAKRALEINKII